MQIFMQELNCLNLIKLLGEKLEYLDLVFYQRNMFSAITWIKLSICQFKTANTMRAKKYDVQKMFYPYKIPYKNILLSAN